MTDKNIRPSSRKTARRSQRMVTAAVVSALLVTAIGVAVSVRNTKRARPVIAEESLQGTARGPQDVRVSNAKRASRAVYKHSIVDGGVFSQDEVRNAVANDEVVAAHYAPIVIADTRVKRVTAPRQAYMSYRIGDKVYWTKRKMTLQPGEAIITDGTSEIRARCGNRISDLAMQPTLENEPSAGEFDAATLPADPTSSEGDAAGVPLDVNEQALASPDPDVLGIPAGDVEEVPALIAAAPLSGGGRILMSRKGGGSTGSNGGGGTGGGDPKDGDKKGGDEPKGPEGPGDKPGPNPPSGPKNDDPPYLPPTPPADTPESVPEPGSLLLIGTGLAAYALRRRARSKGQTKVDE